LAIKQAASSFFSSAEDASQLTVEVPAKNTGVSDLTGKSPIQPFDQPAFVLWAKVCEEVDAQNQMQRIRSTELEACRSTCIVSVHLLHKLQTVQLSMRARAVDRSLPVVEHTVG